jgi:hypothetical protein
METTLLFEWTSVETALMLQSCLQAQAPHKGNKYLARP